VVATYYLGFLTLGFVTGNQQTWYYAVFLAVLLGLVLFWDSRYRFSRLVIWGLATWGALHMAGGLIPVGDDRILYNVWLLPFLRFDHLVHAWGFGFAGLAVWESLRSRLTGDGSGAALVVLGGLAFGALNEMIEFLITRVVPNTNIGEFENTGWDLVANTVGVSVAASWVRWRRRSLPR
jgi:putative membrane protein